MIILIFVVQKQNLLARFLNVRITIAGFVIYIWDLYEPGMEDLCLTVPDRTPQIVLQANPIS